ncbi:MAG: PIN domain-containing protein [Nitrospirae bacterium]|nr:MAG: PIN domain-containing protein [Nitrospirota bacterium]
MTPPLAIVDTNVVVSGLITRDEAAAVCRILDAMLAGGFPFLLSLPLLREYREVLLRRKIRRLHRLTEAEVDTLLEALVVHAVVRSPEAGGPPAPDPGDPHLWDLLHVEPSSVLVTGDRRLLAQPPPGRGVMDPRAFRELLPSLRGEGR